MLAVLILRGVLSPFAHPLFTSMTGIGCGLAATSRSAVARVLYVLVGYGFAVLLHALWNGSATLGDGGTFLGVYLFVMVPLFIAMIVLVLWQRRREQRTVADQLPGFAHGRLDRAERGAAAVEPGRAQPVAAGGAAAFGQGGRAGRHRVPDCRHRTRVPALPDESRCGRAAGAASGTTSAWPR